MTATAAVDGAGGRPGTRALLAAGIEARRSGDHAAALQFFETAAAAGTGDARLHHEIASAALALGRLDRAEAGYRAALALAPDFVDSLRGLGHLARRRGDHRAALDHFETAVARSGDIRAAFEAAMERLELGSPPASAYEALLNDGDARPRACLDIGQHCLRRGEPVAARRWFEEAAAAQPENRAARLALADLALRRWDAGEAVGHYDQVLARAPDDVEALLGRARAMKMGGRHGAALASLEAAHRLDPRRTAVEFAGACREQGDFGRARALLDGALAREPRNAAFLVQIGLLARAMGNRADAIHHFERALAAVPNHVSARVELAADLLRDGRGHEAWACLQKARAAAPDNCRVLEGLGDVELAAERRDAAVFFYGRAAAADPNALSPVVKRARSRAMTGRVEEALASIARFTGANGLSPDAALAQAQILKEAGRPTEAAEVVASARTRFPDHFVLGLQATLFGIDQFGHAPQGPLAATTPSEVAKARIVEGAWASHRRDVRTAQAAFEHALDHHAGDGAIRLRAAQAAMGRLDLDAAETHLRALALLDAPVKKLRGQRAGPFDSLLGQILDEARIDRAAVAAARHALDDADRGPTGALATSLRSAPGITLIAMAALIAWRRGGALSRSVARSGAQRIPRSIVQFWHDETLPPDVEAFCATWPAYNSEFDYRRFSQHAAAAWLAGECDARVQRAFRRARDPALKADLFRLAYLERCGGIYADADDRCVAPLGDLLAAGPSLILYQEGLGSIANDFIAAVPGHPFVRSALDLACEALDSGDCDLPWLATGPGLFSRVLAQAIAERGPTLLAEWSMTILERHELVAAVVTGCSAAYKHTRRYWSRAAFTPGAGRPAKPPRHIPLRTRALQGAPA